MEDIFHYLRRRSRNLSYKTAAWRFKHSVPKRVWDEHDAWMATSRSLARFPLPEEQAGGPVFALSQKLRREALAAFHNRYAHRRDLRVLIHVPPAKTSMGGFSLFNNWLDGLRHMGVPAEALPTGVSAMDAIERFRPTVFMTSDHSDYLRWIDWAGLKKYRDAQPMALVLTASAEHDGNTPAGPRLQLARERGVSFYVSFREPEYIEEHLAPWTEAGFDVISIPFSANPVWQYHVPFAEPPLDYVFLASINPEKAPRYLDYITPVVKGRRGVISGPGWGLDGRLLDLNLQPNLYAMGAVGLNLHIPVSMELLSEVNERTFILAACGMFQLCDAPRVLRRFFPETAVPAAATGAEYGEMFRYYLANPAARMTCQLASLDAVYAGHTIFDRMDRFLKRASLDLDLKV